jgi:hypothetical protein
MQITTKRPEARKKPSSSGDPSLKAPAALEFFYFSGSRNKRRRYQATSKATTLPSLFFQQFSSGFFSSR